MTVLWIEPAHCRWCGEWTYGATFCSDVCESLSEQKRWVEYPALMQVEEVKSG